MLVSKTLPDVSVPRAIAIMSGKGGTGKSIITASLAYLLAHIGFRTLVIDTDLFTSGISFFLFADTPRRVTTGLRDVICSGFPEGQLKPIAISNEYCRGNLYLIPSISSGRDLGAEFQATIPAFDDTSYTLSSIVATWLAEFDYVLLDTRGGSDFTSIAAAKAAGAAIIVTEADKTSWDVGEVLLRSIDKVRGNDDGVLKLGFILNKNVLPAEAIVAFIRRKWECPHLATIPLDKDAISYFQEDKVPVSEDPSSLFSAAIIPVVRKIFWSPEWSKDQEKTLQDLERQALRSIRREQYLAQRQRILQNFGQLMSLIAVIAMILLIVSPNILGSLTDSYAIALGFTAIITILFTNSQLFDTLLKNLFSITTSSTNKHISRSSQSSDIEE